MANNGILGISDGKMNLRSLKIQARMKSTTFHKIMFHFNSKLLTPILADSHRFIKLRELTLKWATFYSKSGHIGEIVIQRFHANGKK